MDAQARLQASQALMRGAAAEGSPLLGTALMVAVPLRIDEFRHVGGPTEQDVAHCHEFAIILGEHGDILLYGGKAGRDGWTAAKLFNELAYCIAVMAFAPGGIEIFGHRWEAIA